MKLGHLLSRPARLLLLIPIIWGVSKLTFVAMPPHAYATYSWLLSVTLFGAVAAMSPTILTLFKRRWSPLRAKSAASSGS